MECPIYTCDLLADYTVKKADSYFVAMPCCKSTYTCKSDLCVLRVCKKQHAEREKPCIVAEFTVQFAKFLMVAKVSRYNIMILLLVKAQACLQ